MQTEEFFLNQEQDIGSLLFRWWFRYVFIL